VQLVESRPHPPTPKRASTLPFPQTWPVLDPDAMEEEEYRGGTRIICDNVPEEVTAGMLITWLNAGLDDDDPDLVSAKIQLEETLDNLSKVEKQIRELPSMKVQGSNAKEELELKMKRAQTLNMQKVDLEDDVRALRDKFEQTRRDRESMVDNAFTVKLAETRVRAKAAAVWRVPDQLQIAAPA
jgi:hypothetical protein